jgi:hypothetical protein
MSKIFKVLKWILEFLKLALNGNLFTNYTMRTGFHVSLHQPICVTHPISETSEVHSVSTQMTLHKDYIVLSTWMKMNHDFLTSEVL